MTNTQYSVKNEIPQFKRKKKRVIQFKLIDLT